MRKKLVAMLAVSALALGSASAFADLGEDMDTLAENLQVLLKTLKKRPRRSWKAKGQTAQK